MLAAGRIVSAQTRLLARRDPSDAPGLSLRPFLLAPASDSRRTRPFEPSSARPFQPIWGGGLQLAFRNGFYRRCHRLAVQEDRSSAPSSIEGEGFGLGIPLTVTVTPLELTVGARTRATPTVFPYVGAGIGTYRYEETSEFDDGTVRTPVMSAISWSAASRFAWAAGSP